MFYCHIYFYIYSLKAIKGYIIYINMLVKLTLVLMQD